MDDLLYRMRWVLVPMAVVISFAAVAVLVRDCNKSLRELEKRQTLPRAVYYTGVCEIPKEVVGMTNMSVVISGLANQKAGELQTSRPATNCLVYVVLNGTVYQVPLTKRERGEG